MYFTIRKSFSLFHLLYNLFEIELVLKCAGLYYMKPYELEFEVAQMDGTDMFTFPFLWYCYVSTLV